MTAMSSALMVRATSLDDIRFHREVFGEAESVEHRRRPLVPLVDALPELAVVLAGEGCRVLLALVLEDRLDLEPQFLLAHRDEPARLRDVPLLPRAAVEPHLGAREGELLERLVDGFLAHAVRTVRVREVAGHEDDL